MIKLTWSSFVIKIHGPRDKVNMELLNVVKNGDDDQCNTTC